MEIESMKKLKSTVEKCVEELVDKQTLTPAETKALKDGLEVCDILDCKIEDRKMEEGKEYSERGYSGHEGAPYRQYHITSYGRMMRVPSMSHGDRSYEMRPMEHYSGDYGVQGWYRSGDGMSNCGPDPYHYGPEYYDRGRGYSRHSIGDRAVEKLEKMMDATQSDYEREELRRYIHLIRQNAD